MYKLVIGITASALEAWICDTLHFSKANDRIRQHKILFSDTLCEAYEKHFGKNDNVFFFHHWMADAIRYDLLQYVDSIPSSGIIDDLISQMKSFPHHIVVYHKDSIQECVPIEFISLESANSQKCDNTFAKYCIPMNSMIRIDDSASEFSKWLEDVLSGETCITIIDHYILNISNNNVLKNLYLPSLPINAKIHIHYGSDCEEQSVISDIKNRYGERIQMHRGNPKDFHDRYIVCNSFFITIGKGFDVFDIRTGKAETESYCSMSDGDRPTIPRPAQTPRNRSRH